MVFSYGIYISWLLCLIGDVPMVLSYGIYISRLLCLLSLWCYLYLHFSVVCLIDVPMVYPMVFTFLG